MIMGPVTESDLYAPVRDWLTANGCTVRGGDLVAIELKRGLSLALLAKAARRQRHADSVCVAVSRPANCNQWMARSPSWGRARPAGCASSAPAPACAPGRRSRPWVIDGRRLRRSGGTGVWRNEQRAAAFLCLAAIAGVVGPRLSSYTGNRRSPVGRTAAQLTASEKEMYRRGVRRRDELESRARQERALRVARRAAELLKASFGATRVLLFGSLAARAWSHDRSDVDQAVEGVEARDFWRADCRLEEIGDGFEIDLVDLSTAPRALSEAVLRDGFEL